MYKSYCQKEKLTDAAEYVITTCANETISGQMFFYPEDISRRIMTPDEFEMYSDELCLIISKYNSVCDVYSEPGGIIDINLGWNYCPLYEPLQEEQEFDINRVIKSPLESLSNMQN